MEEMHKHKGVERSNGTLRAHPVSRSHKDPQVQKYHNLALANAARAKGKSSMPKSTPKTKPVAQKPAKPIQQVQSSGQVFQQNTINLPVDSDGYIMVDLTSLNVPGLRAKFQRVEGRKRRTVGLEINK